MQHASLIENLVLNTRCLVFNLLVSLVCTIYPNLLILVAALLVTQSVYPVVLKEQFMYVVKTPMIDDNGTRQLTWWPVVLPHEIVAQDLADPGKRSSYFQHLEREDLVTATFSRHEVTRDRGLEHTTPVDILIDGAGFTKSL